MSGATPTPTTAPAGWRDLAIDAVWLFVLLAWSAVWCLTSADRTGFTFDEPFYIIVGVNGWRTEQPGPNAVPDSSHCFGWRIAPRPDLATNQGVMPLPVFAATYPLHAQEVSTGKQLGSLEEGLPNARRVTLFWFALLLISALRLGRAAGGPWAGRVAAGLIAADPTFLAHASLATTDICVTAMLVAFTRAVYAGRSGGWWRRILLPGLWFGVAVTAKLSALLYGGIILTTLEVAYRLSSGALSRPEGATGGMWARRFAAIVMRSVLVVAGVILIGIGLAAWACGMSPPGHRPLGPLLQHMSADDPLRPRYIDLNEKYEQMPNAAVAFAFQWWHNADGRPTFLNGTHYEKGVWFYFPVILAMKTPLPVLLLGLIALTRPGAFGNALMVAATLMLLACLTAKVQIGVRLALPVMAVSYVAIAVAVCRGFRCSGKWLGLGAIAIIAATSVWVWPHGLCYLNQLAGGPAAAHDRVTDSNCDWGQGLPDLIEWHKANGEPPIALWYFGMDPAKDRPPFTLIPFEQRPIRTDADFVREVNGRVLAVGATVLTIRPYDPPEKAVCVRYLQAHKPLARTATFLIYDFRDPAGPPLRE